MFLADLHIQSTFSNGKLTIPEIVDLYGAAGFGAIAITDHLWESNTFMGKAAVAMNRTLTPAMFPLYLEIIRTEAERAMKKYGMVVLPGFALTRHGAGRRPTQVLGIGVTEFVSANADAVELAKAVRAQGAVAVAGRGVSSKLHGDFDAYEVARGSRLFTKLLASKLPKLVGSAMSRKRQLASWKTVFFCERSSEAILNAIRKQELSFTYYQGQGDVSDVVRSGSNARLVAGDELAQSSRHALIPAALSLKAAQREQDTAARFSVEASQRYRKRYLGKSRELL